MQIALALIVKPTDDEAVFLNNCLENVSPYVDGIFLTVTGQNKTIDRIAKKYNAIVSRFEWVDDFSKARNFNFSQVPKEYDYILWCDADDTFRGLDKLKETLEQNKVDALAFNYLYEFDEYKNPIVVHKKTQVIKNDGCVSWIGRLHEDFHENRGLTLKFVPFIERIHMTTPEHSEQSKKRNVIISQKELADNPNDPRMNYNLGNSYYGSGDYVQAKEQYKIFLDKSQSDEEKFIVLQRLSDVERLLGNKDEAIKNMQLAIGMNFELPDGYISLGHIYAYYQDYDNAERYFLKALITPPQYHKTIVYNPREYDYNTMLALARVYLNKSRPDLALPMLKGCLKIYPDTEYIRNLVEAMEKETARLEEVLKIEEEVRDLSGEETLKKINSISKDLQSHPLICQIRNKYLVKTESTGKDIYYYCGQTAHEWNPEMAKTKGIGGSEEAVINLSREWAKMGYNVTVFNSCGFEEMVCDGVTYKPFWAYNANDKVDITIAWRHPKLADYSINTNKLYIDLHDVIPPGEFTENRLKNIDKVFVKTEFHKSLFPNIPEDKFAVIPNGQDFSLFNQQVKKDPMLLVNTSSPERSLDVLPKLFKKVKEQVPKARCKWAYGFEIFDNAHRTNKQMMAWKDKVIREMEEAGIENCGRLSQKEVAKLYLEGSILAYPSEFAEIDCISVKKAQACGCVPITSDFGAFAESNKYGIKIKSKKTKDNWSKPYQLSYGIEDEEAQNKWVEETVRLLKSPIDTSEMVNWAKKFDWVNIAKQWLE